VVATADREVVEEAPSLTTDLRIDDLTAAGWLVTGPELTPDGEMTITLAHPFSTIAEANHILGQLSGPDGPFVGLVLSQQRAFAKVVTRVTGSIRTTNGVATFGDGDLLARIGGKLPYENELVERGLTLDQALALRLSVTAPGKAELSDGSASPPVGGGFDQATTVNWTAQLAGAAASPTGQSINLEATLEDATARQADRLREFAPWALAAWSAFFLLVILPIAYLIRRRYRDSAAIRSPWHTP
jgi:hypothetical protein